MTYHATCQLCDQSGTWSTAAYRDQWLRTHLEQTGHDRPFTIDPPEPAPRPPRNRDASDRVSDAVWASLRRQRGEQ